VISVLSLAKPNDHPDHLRYINLPVPCHVIPCASARDHAVVASGSPSWPTIPAQPLLPASDRNNNQSGTGLFMDRISSEKGFNHHKQVFILL